MEVDSISKKEKRLFIIEIIMLLILIVKVSTVHETVPCIPQPYIFLLSQGAILTCVGIGMPVGLRHMQSK